jgi:hypothetical protein
LKNFAEVTVRYLAKLMLIAALVPCAARMGFSRGDKIIPQVVDGPGWVTKFDITNISSFQQISHMRLSFYKSNGTKWSLQTSLGPGTDFILNLAARQTLRVETQGAGNQVTAGYAVIYDEETGNSDYSEDYVLGISVFYVYSSSSGIADTVTVSVPQPTAAADVPLQMDRAHGIYSGLAIINWAGASNSVDINLYSADGTAYGSTRTIPLALGEQWSGFLDNAALFPGLDSFKGMAEITSVGPIALLGLLQTQSADGSPQYSTLVPVDRESLRRNTYMVLLQASTNSYPFMPIDFDNFAVDYFRNSDGTEGYSWDLEYRYSSSNRANRYLQPDNGAGISAIGSMDAGSFDAISVVALKGRTYSTSATIDLSDGSSNLQPGFAFAVRTDVGNYAKARILRVIDTTDTTMIPGTTLYNEDLVLEVCIYK